MSRLWAVAVSMAPIALVFVACGGSGSHSGSPAPTAGAAGSHAGAGLVGGGGAIAGSGLGGAGQATSGSGAQAAGESPGGNAAGGAVAIGGSSNVAGTSGSAGAQSSGGSGWIVPATPGAGWSGPQDPACPSAAVSSGADCTSPPGTRCSYAETGGVYTLRCQCYTSSTGEGRWWCDHQASFGYDSCPVAYPGNGSCPVIGDVTCFYVDDQDKLKACNCAVGTSQCFPWGL